MKSILFPFLVIILLIVNCSEPSRTGAQNAANINDPLEGAWEFVSSKVVLPDTVISLDGKTTQKGVFMMSDGHFAFINTSQDKTKLTYAGHGSYTIEGQTFTERTEFHTATALIGKSTKWTFKIEGGYLTKSGSLPVWAEIKPFAGEATEVQFEEVRRRMDD